MTKWIANENRLGQTAVDEFDAKAFVPLGTRVRMDDRDGRGSGEFIYLKGVASTTVASWVTYNPDDWTTALLVADTKAPVAIAMSANIVATTFGWYQIEGLAVGKALAGYVDNALVYATATAGSVDDAVVAGDRVKNAIGASALGVPSAGLAEFEISFPFTDDGSAS